MDPLIAEIFRLHELGESMRRIACRVGYSRKKVRKILVEAGRIPRDTKAETNKGPRSSKLDRFRETIQELAAQGLGSPRILRELRTMGYDGGRTILVEYLREIRPAKVPRAYRRFETAVAEEAQADWSPYRVMIRGVLRTVHAFALVLAFSRLLHIRFYWNERLPTLLYALEQAFGHARGITRRVVFDNMTTVTLGRVNRRPVFHERFLEFSRHCMFEPVVCRPYDPNRKGKVERPFAYLEKDFLRGRSFESLAELNAEAERWLREVANARIHGTTHRVPFEVWKNEEQPLLIPLPERPFGSYRQEVRRVHIDGLFSFDGVRYSAPSHLAGTQVTVRATPDDLDVLDALGNRVATHAVSERSGHLVINPDHQPPRERTSQRELEEAILRRFPGTADFMAGLRRRQGTFAHLHCTKLRRLATRFPESDLLAAIQRATELRSFSAHTVARLLANNSREVPEPPTPLNAQAVLEVIEEDDDRGGLEQYRELEEGENHAA